MVYIDFFTVPEIVTDLSVINENFLEWEMSTSVLLAENGFYLIWQNIPVKLFYIKWHSFKLDCFSFT